ncbi:MAG: SDR family NAD(P)-dependent oxidoreductase [Planctomycetaceae bacterium]
MDAAELPQLPPPFASLRGSRAVVTGASSGIGQAIARQFALAGADVLIHACKSAERLNVTAAELLRYGAAVETCLADLGTASGRERLVEQSFDRFPNLHIWVNNAGVDLLTGPGAGWTMPRSCSNSGRSMFEARCCCAAKWDAGCANRVGGCC